MTCFVGSCIGSEMFEPLRFRAGRAGAKLVSETALAREQHRPVRHEALAQRADHGDGRMAEIPAKGRYPIEWLREPLTVADADRMFPRANPKWEELKSSLRPGDEFWRFKSPPDSWRRLAGRAGIALVRNRTIVHAIVTMLN
jgi:hypothetical protein